MGYQWTFLGLGRLWMSAASSYRSGPLPSVLAAFSWGLLAEATPPLSTHPLPPSDLHPPVCAGTYKCLILVDTLSTIWYLSYRKNPPPHRNKRTQTIPLSEPSFSKQDLATETSFIDGITFMIQLMRHFPSNFPRISPSHDFPTCQLHHNIIGK